MSERIRPVHPIAVELIEVSRWNPRTLDPDDPATRQLAESMAGTGLIQPIAVRVHPAAAGKFELLAGSRRLAAARLLGWKEIDAEVHHVDDQTAVSIIVVENLQRKELTPLEEATGLRALLEIGASRAEIAQQIGWPLSRVARRAQLLKLIPDWWERASNPFDLDQWTAGHLEVIARLPEEQQRLLLRRGFLGRTIEEVEESVRSELGVLADAEFPTEDDELVKKAGPCTACPKRASEQPELFWDDDAMPKNLAGEDRCLDRGCWDKKMKAHVARELARAREKNPAVVPVSTSYYGGGKQVLHAGAYTNARKSDANSIEAVVVHGKGIGKRQWIKLRPGIRLPGGKEKGARQRGPTKQEREQKLMLERQEFVEKSLAAAVMRAGQEKVLYGAGGDPAERALRLFLAYGCYDEYDPNVELIQVATLEELLGQLWDTGIVPHLSAWSLYSWGDDEWDGQMRRMCEMFGVVSFDELWEEACQAHPAYPGGRLLGNTERSWSSGAGRRWSGCG